MLEQTVVKRNDIAKNKYRNAEKAIFWDKKAILVFQSNKEISQPINEQIYMLYCI